MVQNESIEVSLDWNFCCGFDSVEENNGEFVLFSFQFYVNSMTVVENPKVTTVFGKVLVNILDT